jgi:hypothetical protein
MKINSLLKLPVITLAFLLVTMGTYAQQTGDFRSAATGDWSAAETWQTFDGNDWIAAAGAPAGSENITIGGDHVVSADVAVTISGFVKVEETGQFTVSDGTITFADESTYEHARDGGSIPVSDWQSGSTMLLTGTTGSAPGNRNQSYHHLVINTPDNSSNKDFGFDGITIGGDITILATGSSRWQLTSGSSGTTREFSIMGNVTLESGQFAMQGTGNGDTHFTVNHYGDVVVNDGNFSIARGSQGGTGTSSWILHAGDLILNAGTSQSSNSGGAQWIFAGSDVQNFQVSDVYVINGAGLKTDVLTGAVVNLGNSVIAGSGDFDLAAGAALYTGNIDGLSGTLTTSGTITLSDEALYTFNGTEAQVTGDLLPTTVASLVIDNTAGVTLTQTTTITSTLVLRAGVFDNTIPFVLAEGAEVITEGGSLLVGLPEDADYRAAATGDWSDPATWEVLTGENWVPATNAPTGAETITIAGDFVVTVDTAVTVTGYITVEETGQLATGDGTLTFIDGSTYQHNRDGGSIPVSDWQTGSTMYLTGTVGSAPGNRNQSYHHLVIDTPENSSNKDFGFDEITIGGDVTVNTTGTGSNRWQLTSGSSGTTREFSIMGDVTLNSGQFAVQGTGNGNTHFTVNHYGNVTVNDGNFSLSRGSQGGTGTTTWNLIGGDLNLVSGTTQSSNNLGSQIVFAGTEVQNLVLNPDYTISGAGLKTTVNGGAILNLGSSVIPGTGNFDLLSGAELQTAHIEGLLGSLATSGEINLSTAAIYTFNGSEAQVTSSMMPATVASLVIDNAAGVTLSQETTINTSLVLRAGVLDNTIPFTIGPAGEIIYDGGSLLIDVSEELEFDEGDFRAAASGNWSSPDSWNTYESGVWVAATTAPTGTEFVLIDSTFVISVDVAVSVAGTVLVIDEGQLTVGDGSLAFENGSTYEHGRDGGSVPLATWEEGSTFYLTGTITGAPGNRNQSFHHIVINTPENGGNRDFGFDGITIGGDITIYATGTGSNRWQLTSGSSGTTREFSIMGNVTLEDGQFALQGTGNGDTHFTVNHYGDVVVNSGNFSIARGSQGGTGTSTWNLHAGDLTLNAGTTQNSNNDGARWVFAGSEVQNVQIADGYTISGTGLNMNIDPGAIVNLGNSVIAGTGTVDLAGGAEMQTSHADGLAGNLTTTGTLSLSEEGSYTFHGSAMQVTSTLMPATVHNLTINNSNRVTLSQETVINGTLFLLAGIFDNTIPFTLGPDGDIVINGGQLLIEPIDYEEGTIRSVASGVWSDPATWEVLSEGSWAALESAPSGDVVIYIVNDHLVEVSDSVFVEGQVIVVAEAELAVGEEGKLIFGTGSSYTHDRNAGSMPTAEWQQGSTFYITGAIDTAPDNRNQNYYNIDINTPLLSSNLDLDLNDVTIGGNIVIHNTGAGSRWYLSTASAGETRTITIMGNVNHINGNFSVQGTGNAETHFTVHHYGNIDVRLGNFSISRGSQGSGSGSTTWYLYEGDFTMLGGVTQNSNADNAKWVFAGDGVVQRLDIRSIVTVQGSGLQMEINEGAILNVGNSNIRANGDFTLHAGAELQSTAQLGLEDNLTTTGAVSLSQDASYAFVGSQFQETSFLMPQTVRNLIIDNNGGVFHTRETTINGQLILRAGLFDNTIPFFLGPDAEIVYEGGSLLIPVSIEEREDIPTVFDLKQNYPNPFNPSTRIRYDIPENAHVELTVYDVTGRLVAKLVNGQHVPGRYTVEWNASRNASGMYLYRITAGDYSAVKQLMLIK